MKKTLTGVSRSGGSPGKARYRVDLRQFIGVCEVNYRRLLRLMPDLHRCDERVFGVLDASEQLSQVRLVVTERSKYTTTINAIQESSLSDWVPKPVICVRLYHDAHMAEVLSFQNSRYPQSKYPYPNAQMHQPDEKAQLNVFLGEWLAHCQHVGCINEPIRF